MIKTAQGPPHLSANNPFFLKKLLFFGLEQKTRKRKHFFSFSASSSSHLHSEQRGNFYSLFINLCNFFFLPSKKNLFFYFSRRDFFVEMWKIDVLICTWIVWSGWSYLFLDNGFLYFGFREDQISGFVCVDVWRLPLSLWSLRYDWFSLVNEISSLICVMS